MIILHAPTDGYSEYEVVAKIKDGEIVEGDFELPPDVDLSDEDGLVDRYNGPGLVASKVSEEKGEEIPVANEQGPSLL